MASEKPTMILAARTDFSLDEIREFTDREAWQIIYSLRSRKAKDNRLQVCFTGFGVDEKEKLVVVARSSKFKVVGSVTKKLDFLVGGANAGPMKIAKAESQGVQYLEKLQFVHFLETGELPESCS